MRIVIAIILAITLVISIGVWKVNLDIRRLNGSIKTDELKSLALKKEAGDLDKYRDEKGVPLDKFYLEVFNDIKDISFYYHASSEIKIPEAKDLGNIAQAFRPSQYRGIRCADIACRISLKNILDTNLFEALYKILKNKPVDILEWKIEKDNINLTMRLYGS